MLIRNLLKNALPIMLATTLTSPLCYSAPPPDEPSHNNLHLLAPETFNKVIQFITPKFQADEYGKINHSVKGWHFSAFQQNTQTSSDSGIPSKDQLALAIPGKPENIQSGIIALNMDKSSRHVTAVFSFNAMTSSFTFNGNIPKFSMDGYMPTFQFNSNGPTVVPGPNTPDFKTVDTKAFNDMDASKTDLPYGLEGQGHKGFVSAAKLSYQSAKSAFLHVLNSMNDSQFGDIKEITNSDIKFDLVLLGHGFRAPEALLTASFLLKELGLTSAHQGNIKLMVTTLGSPRVFDDKAAMAIESLFDSGSGSSILRFEASPFDMITNIPTEYAGYKHVGSPIAVSMLTHFLQTGVISKLHDTYRNFNATSNVAPVEQTALLPMTGLPTLSTNSYLNTAINGLQNASQIGSSWHDVGNYVSSIHTSDAYKNYFHNVDTSWYTPSGIYNNLGTMTSHAVQKGWELINTAPYYLLMMLMNQGQQQHQTAPAA